MSLLRSMLDHWTLYKKTTKPAPEREVQTRQAYYSGALAMYELMLFAMTEVGEDERINAIRRLGHEAGDALLSTVPADLLHQKLMEALGMQAHG